MTVSVGNQEFELRIKRDNYHMSYSQHILFIFKMENRLLVYLVELEIIDRSRQEKKKTLREDMS